ncbi:MAG: hypothetical protein ACRERE_29475 [Candidatus Entotheonellia bacterium]
MSLLVLRLVSSAAAEAVHCTTREDRAFDRLMTTCTDGSRAITRYDPAFKRWVTTVTRPGEASKVVPSNPARPRGQSR